MGYTALKQMQKINAAKYGIPFPQEPRDLTRKKNISNIERSCLKFIRESCEGLRFDETKNGLEDRDGKSARAGQIPFNMEKDIDRICLENAIHRFMQSGVAQDAFDVYFCYLEMFVGRYGKSKKMIEMLAEFESNASALLMKHRDHYSHSVYVFVLGLAIYEENAMIREAYNAYYKVKNAYEGAHHFLKYWGLTSLFHDIGYPFELPFEQVKSYFGNTIKNVPFVAYKGIDAFIRLPEDVRQQLEAGTGYTLESGTINELVASNIQERLGDIYHTSAAALQNEVLDRKPAAPDEFSGFMDHAYFSGVVLLHQLIEVMGAQNITMVDIDAVSAIMLHNSMYKFSITNIGDEERNQPFDLKIHPLAYVLMLCDELQCWDRTSYGQNSRQELHAMWCDLEFAGNDMRATYYYDSRLEYKKDYAKGSYRKMTDEAGTFLKDIERIIKMNTSDAPGLSLDVRFIKNNRATKLNMSSSSFMHLYNFAMALNGRYAFGDDNKANQQKLEDAFEGLSLEYKLSNILQAKEFSRHLEAVGCFYTDKPVAYELLDEFTEAQMDIIGPLEHTRWVKEKESMGWHFGEDYPNSRVRECTRTHKLMIPDYDELDEVEQNKDTAPMNLMLKLIEEYDGLRIYRLN